MSTISTAERREAAARLRTLAVPVMRWLGERIEAADRI